MIKYICDVCNLGVEKKNIVALSVTKGNGDKLGTKHFCPEHYKQITSYIEALSTEIGERTLQKEIEELKKLIDFPVRGSRGLTDEAREFILTKAQQDYHKRAIAEAMGISYNTVIKHLSGKPDEESESD